MGGKGGGRNRLASRVIHPTSEDGGDKMTDQMQWSFTGRARNLLAGWRLFVLREAIIQPGKSQRDVDSELVAQIRRDLEARKEG